MTGNRPSADVESLETVAEDLVDETPPAEPVEIVPSEIDRTDVRAPSFANLQALPLMIEGSLLSDVVAAIGSIDIVLGEVDR